MVLMILKPVWGKNQKKFEPSIKICDSIFVTHEQTIGQGIR